MTIDQNAPPNILLIMTDQHRADHLGCYGNGVIQTPHIDALAARGMQFNHAYVSSGVCMPNRATLMTGRTPTVNGVQTNGLSLPLDATTFVDVLRDSGYRTALFGKSHLQNLVSLPVGPENYPTNMAADKAAGAAGKAFADAYRTPRSGPEYNNERLDLWRADSERDVDRPYYGFETARFTLGHDETCHGHYDAWLRARHDDPHALQGPQNALPADGYSAPQVWRTAVPEELYTTAYIESETADYLDRHAVSGAEAPFFVQCSFPDPHHPFSPPGRYFDMYDPADCHPPASFDADIRNAPPLREKLFRQLADNARDLRVAAFACTESEVREYIALTYGMISMVDDAIGRLMQKLKDLGLDQNTVVLFTSDHGDLMGDHGLMFKHCFHDQGITHVPLIWADPAGPHGEASDLTVGTIDIAPTILARAGCAPYHGIQGKDVMAAATGNAELTRGGILVEEDELPLNANCDQYLRTRTIITGRWRMTYWLEYGFGEIYDREADPDEINNLWDAPAAAGDKTELVERMLHEKFTLDDIAPRAPYCA